MAPNFNNIYWPGNLMVPDVPRQMSLYRFPGSILLLYLYVYIYHCNTNCTHIYLFKIKLFVFVLDSIHV